ncbi:hypothetical protein BRADI_2g60254v3 [Brachypodium distachyon]|uniref:Uncharacterized protein n=1 Tax=Brachypodium distachyon TaxID=15368 RepID=A0A2K2DH00_BRADI|nr:hypothetical protein BRADI_2g60254v3 [Brachypodium distachyon]
MNFYIDATYICWSTDFRRRCSSLGHRLFQKWPEIPRRKNYLDYARKKIWRSQTVLV